MKKVNTVIWWLLFIFLLAGGIAGVLYELLPNKSIVPDPVFEVVFYAQFIIIILFAISSVLKYKFKQ